MRVPDAILLLAIGMVLVACGPSQSAQDAEATTAAANMFASQTVDAPTPGATAVATTPFPTLAAPTATPPSVPPTATATSVPPTPTSESTASTESFDGVIGISLGEVETVEELPAECSLPAASAGHAYVSIQLTVTRIEGVHLVNVLGFGEERSVLHDSDGQSYTLDFGTFKGVKFQDPTNIASPSELVEGAEGILVFEIPEDQEPADLILIYTYQETWDDTSPEQRGEMTVSLE